MLGEGTSPIHQLPRADLERYLAEGFAGEKGVIQLGGKPDVSLLKYLTGLPHHTALFRHDEWYAARGITDGVPTTDLEAGGEVIILVAPCQQPPRIALPLPSAIYLAGRFDHNLIASTAGVIEYEPVPVKHWSVIRNEARQSSSSFSMESSEDYKAFLASIGVKYKLHEWPTLDEDRLNLILGNLD